MDRRTSLRVPLSMRAYIYAERRQVPCRVHDMSATGMLVFPVCSARPGLDLRIDFLLPDSDYLPFCLRARLVRETNVHKTYAWGIAFNPMSPGTQRQLSDYIKRKTIRDLECQVRRSKLGTDAYRSIATVKSRRDTIILSDEDIEVVAGPDEDFSFLLKGESSPTITSKARPAKPPRPDVYKPTDAARRTTVWKRDEPKKSSSLDDDSGVRQLYADAVKEATSPTGLPRKKDKQKKKKKSWWR